MARKPRIFISKLPHHVIQRGNNKGQIFFSENDYLVFLSMLKEAKKKHPCRIYTYCLMKNHFHLIVEPEESNNISLLMKLLGAKYVHYINKKYNRTGTLWEGRFKCSLIEEDSYFLTCLRYVEMNPVRAGLCNRPDDYPWSGYKFRAYGLKSEILDIDTWYNSAGDTGEKRQEIYRKLFDIPIPDWTTKLIRKISQRNGIIGSENFIQDMCKIKGEGIILRHPGRPRKNNSDPVSKL